MTFMSSLRHISGGAVSILSVADVYSTYLPGSHILRAPEQESVESENAKIKEENEKRITRGRVGLAYAGPAYHAVLPVNRETASFRGINGRHPAKTRVPAIYSTVSPPLD